MNQKLPEGIDPSLISEELSEADRILIKARNLILKVAIPFTKWMGKVTAPWVDKKGITYYFDVLSVIHPGDLILSVTLGHLSNVFNVGEYKHVIVYVGIQKFGDHEEHAVVEAIGRGVVMRPLWECLADKDRIAIMRMRDQVSEIKTRKAISWLLRQVGKPYDYSFELFTDHGMDNLYCSETGLYFDKMRNPKLQMKLRKVLGVWSVTPDDFRRAESYYECVLEK